MKSNTKKHIENFMNFSNGGDTFNQIMMVLDLPDDQFDKVYPDFKKQLIGAFQDLNVQREVINTVRLNKTSPEEREEAIQAFQEVINEINQDDTLSDNKKDMLNTLINTSINITFDIADNPRERINVNIQKISPDAILPKYAHPSDAGADIFAVEETLIPPSSTVLVKTGLKVAIPCGYEIQIRPRSGLSLKTPLRVANAPGTIDSNYRGEICVIMTNTGNNALTINKGDRIAQMVISPSPMIVWNETDNLDETDRGDGGFGSTGKS